MTRNLIDRAAIWLGSKLQVAGGRTVTYRRGGIELADLTLVPQMHDERVLVDGLPLSLRQYNWTVTLTELLLNGEMVEPQPGDIIEETLNGKTIRWEVLPFDDSGPCWRWMDSAELLITVCTKQVS